MSDKFHFSPRPNKAHEINWQEWSEEAFKQAKQQDKLILLSISAVWCHWCHVMDETAYSHQPNIDLINSEFIPIRVDNDKRPDVNKRFNMGGWPTTVILTPLAEILNGGTYMPEDTLYSFLTNTNQYYQQNKHKANFKYTNLNIENENQDYTQNNQVNEEILTNIDDLLLESFDYNYGGFGTQPKFPHTDALDYLIYRYYNNPDNHMFKIVTKTLDFMADGGIYDNQEGGFFRYSTTQDWSIPHFEKMLEDNSKLLDIYLKAFQITGNTKYADISNGIVDYLNNNLLDKDQGVFYGTQDADENYYNLTKIERQNVEKPHIDKTIYTNWNAMISSAYIRGYYTFKNKSLLDKAQKAMNFLVSNCYTKDKGMYHYYDNSPQMTGILEDQIYTINALLDLYEATSDSYYVYTATDLADLVLKDYYDKNGGFFDDIIEYEFVPSFRNGEKSIELNSFCAQVFFRLYDFSNLEKYKQSAQKTLQLFANNYKNRGIFTALYGISVIRYLSQPVKVSIVGDINDEQTLQMFLESQKNFIPFKVIEVLDIEKDKEKIETFGYDTKAVPKGYICKGTNCFNPVFSARDITNTLNNNLM